MTGRDRQLLAAAYLAIARPANRRLDVEVSGYARNQRSNLRAAESYLRAEAATERWWDRRLLRLPLPPAIAAIARAIVAVNAGRARLTDLQAGSTSIAQLRSLTARHRAADADVEIGVRIIRQVLGLPPPSSS